VGTRDAETEPRSAVDVLVVEDEESVLATLVETLTHAGFRARGCATASEAIEGMATTTPDLVVLDRRLPDMDGLDLCRRLRLDARTRDVAIVILTALDDEDEVLRGFDAGADDYLTKPWRSPLLLRHLRAVLSRTQGRRPDSASVSCGPLVLDPASHVALLSGRPMQVSRSDFDILLHLASRAGQVVSRADLAGPGSDPDPSKAERAIDVRICRLRAKLGRHGRMVVTVHGVGYRMDAPAEA
jgi:two-component system phosphate regulon response regulator PhoB